MNEKIAEQMRANNEKKNTSGTRQIVQMVSDVTEAGIEIKDEGIASVNESNVFRAVMEMFGEKSPAILSGNRPCIIPEYIEYRQNLMANS